MCGVDGVCGGVFFYRINKKKEKQKTISLALEGGISGGFLEMLKTRGSGAFFLCLKVGPLDPVP